MYLYIEIRTLFELSYIFKFIIFKILTMNIRCFFVDVIEGVCYLIDVNCRIIFVVCCFKVRFLKLKEQKYSHG